MTHINEYGGNKYPARRKVKRTSDIDATFSFRCRDCERLRYVTRREMARAARQRCFHCGGTLIETETSHKKIVNRQTSVALAQGRTKFHPIDDRMAAKIRCPYCAVGFVNTRVGISIYAEEHLASHLRGNSLCAITHQNKALIANSPPQWSCFSGTWMLSEGPNRLRFSIEIRNEKAYLYDCDQLPRPQELSSLEEAISIAEKRIRTGK